MKHTNHIQRRQLCQWAAAAMGSSWLSAPALAQAGWAPTQSITFGIGVAPGGSVDLYARGIKQVLETLKLTNGQTMVADNKPGAAGLLILQQLQRNAGNGHQLATFHTGSIAGQVTGMLKADIRDYVPLAMMVEETSLVAVRADSALKTAADVVTALKRDPTSLKIAVAPVKGLNTHLAIAKPLRVAGVDVGNLTVAAFRSSGDSMVALLGGHVDIVSATAPTIIPQVQAGKVRMIASAAHERGTGPLAGVPTWREQGIDAEYISYNGVLLAPGVSPEIIRYWEAAMRQVAQSPEWTSLVERSGNKAMFKGHADSLRYLQTELQETQDLLALLGNSLK